MPAVSFYLKKDVLDSVRARAKSQKIPVSQIISHAVEDYLKSDEMQEARKRVLDHLKHLRKIDRLGTWDELHEKRSLADDDRD